MQSAFDERISKFVLEMKGGSKGLLVNSRDICKSVNRATVKMDGQNGKTHDFQTPLKAQCGKKSKGAKKGKAHSKRASSSLVLSGWKAF